MAQRQLDPGPLPEGTDTDRRPTATERRRSRLRALEAAHGDFVFLSWPAACA